MTNKRIPISYIVKAQIRYIDLLDDCDGEYQKVRAVEKAYNDYLDKMFLDDTENRKWLDKEFNATLLKHGSYKPFCDYLRSCGYEVVSKDNATKQEMKQVEKECLKKWKEWLKDDNQD